MSYYPQNVFHLEKKQGLTVLLIISAIWALQTVPLQCMSLFCEMCSRAKHLLLFKWTEAKFGNFAL